MQTYTSSKGFTLVELLTVIAIIGILATVTIYSLSGARERGRDGERISELSQIALGVELCRDKLGSYPTGTLDLSTSCGGTTELRQFLDPIPTPPGGGNYDYSSDGTGFVVYTDLEVMDPAEHSGYTGTHQSVNCSAALRFCIRD
jgi:prepilin-type N-terminal cleavage/methylation domain-containing protein